MEFVVDFVNVVVVVVCVVVVVAVAVDLRAATITNVHISNR